MNESNHESWVWLVGWAEEMPDPNWTSWKSFALPLLKACMDEGLDQYFRAGQSLVHLIFSTAEEHGLEKYYPPPPRVTAKFDGAKWFIAWSYQNLHFSEADREDPVDSETAFAILKLYLADLWRETRPNESLPSPFCDR